MSGFQRAELEPPTLCRVPRLSKRETETLLESYDRDPVGSLASALRIVLGDASLTWDTIIGHVPDHVADRDLLRARDITAMDAVTKHLVENRGL